MQPGGDPLVLCFVDFLSPAHAATSMDALQGELNMLCIPPLSEVSVSYISLLTRSIIAVTYLTFPFPF